MEPPLPVPNGIQALLPRKFSFPVAQAVKNLPAVQETQVRSPGGKDPLEKEMATHSGIRAWRIPWTEDPGSYSPWGHNQLD